MRTLMSLFAVLVLASGSPAQQVGLPPVPAAAAQARAEKAVRDAFAAEFAKKKSSDQIDLAIRLLNTAIVSSEPEEQYVLLREARDIAARHGDLELAGKAHGELGNRFALRRPKSDLELLEAVAKGPTTNHIAKFARDTASPAVDRAIRADDYDGAISVLKVAAGIATKGKSPTIAAALTARAKDVELVHAEFKRVLPDLVKSQSAPRDPGVSDRAGRFFCFFKGDWKRGLPLLAETKDAQLKDLASKDLANPQEPAALVELADGWWKLGSSLSKVQQIEIQLRAGKWYEQAKPQLAGLTQVRVERRLEEIDKIAGGRVRSDAAAPAEAMPKAPAAGGVGGGAVGSGFQCRLPAARAKMLEEFGGDERTEAAVVKGLGWLARHQVKVTDTTAYWPTNGNFPDKGGMHDEAGTAFGLLPFLAAGKTHANGRDNPYDKTIERGLNYLIAKQDKRTGAFSKDTYAHGICTIAMCEAYGMTKDQKLKPSAQMALNYIVAAQHPAGGWRYSPGQAGDTSVSGWHVMALKTGKMAGLDVPAATWKKAQGYLDGCCHAPTEGYGYTDGNNPTKAMTAVGLLARQTLQDWSPDNVRMTKAIENYLTPNVPRAGANDVYFYYYATQVLRNAGGDTWKTWNDAYRDLLVTTQSNDQARPEVWGSWSPTGAGHSATGGRLMVTSLNLLSLEIYYRYPPPRSK